MNEPRPRVISARPLEAALSVEKRSNTRIGSSVLKHRNRRAEVDPLGAAGDRRQHNLGRGYGKVRAMMLADAKGVDAEFVGQHRLIDHVADDLRVAQQVAVGARRDVAESIETKLEVCCHGFRQCFPSMVAVGGCRLFVLRAKAVRLRNPRQVRCMP